MPFMQQQVTNKQRWIEVDTSHGITFIPCDYFGTAGLDTAEELSDDIKTKLLQYTESYKLDQIYSAHITEGYGARLSAPGYMERTEWTVFPTEEEAKAYLDEYYPEDEEEEATEAEAEDRYWADKRQEEEEDSAKRSQEDVDKV